MQYYHDHIHSTTCTRISGSTSVRDVVQKTTKPYGYVYVRVQYSNCAEVNRTLDESRAGQWVKQLTVPSREPPT